MAETTPTAGRRRNVFVLGLTDLHRRELECMRGAEEFTFHGLLDFERLVLQTDYDIDDLLEQARAELAEFQQSGATVDAIVSHWDFPSSVMAPILASEHGIPAPSLVSMLKCEHKYWSRLEQRASVPEVVPGFTAFDPFAEDVRGQIDLPFPFWVKPVKAHSSALGFMVTDEESLAKAVAEIRAEITDLGDAFNQVLARVDLPEELHGAGGNSCLAEQVMTGIQAAPEGTVSGGQFHVHGMFDMLKDPAGESIARLDYPAATVPQEVQQRMVDTAERFLRHIGYDDGAFNVEYMWDQETDKLWLIEVNTRISQSHSELFLLVDGSTNHEVAIDVALGRRPALPSREGRYEVAAKCAIMHHSDGVVTRVPGEEEFARVDERFPGTRVSLQVEPGDRLSELPHQDEYNYILGSVYLGADSHEGITERFEQVTAMLPIDITAAPEDVSLPEATA
ncbi:ATP-grasp domain-containing protein [Ornithinicoccus halotolerans]|uniref:ATP-grasp domain-containing protein n=1 Tax=Ornithinicoccus halotolerans TaxID=1748220 RepID=UPI00129661BE|nr:hypothetical protein [Ornithinicoccus halotolerans]